VAVVDYPEPFQELVRQLRRLPGVGPRSAERMALWVIKSEAARAQAIAESMLAAKATILPCPRCGFFSLDGLCALCSDEARQGREICVVENATDILPLERTAAFRGLYHALGGRIAPLDNVGPEDLRIPELIERVRTEKPTEIILALSADVEGEATANYLAEVLRGAAVPVTHIAQGLPAGGGLEHADEVTLMRALAGRMARSGAAARRAEGS